MTDEWVVKLPDNVVAILALPMPLDGLLNVTRGMEAMYGKGLVILTDIEIEGWMFIARRPVTT